MQTYPAVRTRARERLEAGLKRRFSSIRASKTTIPLALKLMPKWLKLLDGESNGLTPFKPDDEAVDSVRPTAHARRLYVIHEFVKHEFQPMWTSTFGNHFAEDGEQTRAWLYASRLLISYFLAAASGDLEQVRAQAAHVENCL